MTPELFGICKSCKKRVPSEHVVRDGKVYLASQCPDCGADESLISNDPAAWQAKRDLLGYDPQAEVAVKCRINCHECPHQHHPKMAFLDVTNRCNMNCPICINNTPAMGFVFNPPLEYFEKVLAGLAAMDPKPTVQLFGGEPTVRDDLFEIIDLCRKHGLRVRIVTNGLKLADEEYCKKLCDAKVAVLLAFDGNNPEIYDRLRKNPGAYQKKIKALDNLGRFSRRKSTIMTCVARGINDKHMGELIQMVHERRAFIDALHLIPLTENWEAGEFETDVHTTMEDVERIIDEALPDDPVEFLPTGFAHDLRNVLPFFGEARLTFGGVHPNCESITILLSDGEQYRPLSHFLNRPLAEMFSDLRTRVKKLEPKLQRLDPNTWWGRWRGRLMIARSLGGLVRRSINFRRAFKGHPVLGPLRILGGLAIGRRGKDVFRKHTGIHNALRMIVLPFEEYDAIDSARLLGCTAGFAFEDPDTGEVRTIPVCSFPLYKNDLQRKIAEKYSNGSPPDAEQKAADEVREPEPEHAPGPGSVDALCRTCSDLAAEVTIDNARDYVVGVNQKVPLYDGREARYVNLDNAATTPPFKPVVECSHQFLDWYASVHRGSGFKSQVSTHVFERCREVVAEFVGADLDHHAVIFTQNATHALNKLAMHICTGSRNSIITTAIEHHSNLLPWRKLGCDVAYVGINHNDGTLDMADLEAKVRSRAGRIGLVTVTGASNVTGVIPPIREIARLAHENGALFALDASQLVAHRPFKMGAPDDPERVDFLALSAHKMYAPFGSGVLVGPKTAFEGRDPDHVGGGTVDAVTNSEVMWAPLPEKEEAGTPNLPGCLALACAAKVLEAIGLDNIAEHERDLTRRALAGLSRLDGVAIYGPTVPPDELDRVGSISFNVDGYGHAELAAILGHEWGIGVRNGCFCAQPYVRELLGISDEEMTRIVKKLAAGDHTNVPGMVRASIGVYNTADEVDYLVEAVGAILAEGPRAEYALDQRYRDYVPQPASVCLDDYLPI